MAKKIEGWAIEQYAGGGRFLFEHIKHSSEYSKATLVVSDERVFTESEVRVILEAMCVIPRFIGNSILTRDLEQALRSVAEQSGIVLDPVQPTNP